MPGRIRNIGMNETVLAHRENVYTIFTVHRSDHLPQRALLSSIREVFNTDWRVCGLAKGTESVSFGHLVKAS